MPYPSAKRQEQINRIDNQHFDIIVIGGGITGAGIALDAATRGFKVALIEKQDFAAGTSSRSTKLIHGGLRYLKNLDFKLVRDTGLERAVAYKNAPHLVRPEKMLLPLSKDGSYGKTATNFGLWLYDLLAGVKGDDRRKMLNKAETIAKEPLLNGSDLDGSGYYAEYRTDDARLTLEVLKTAAQKGAHIINYVSVEALQYDNKKVKGVNCIDQLNDTPIQLTADYIVNATGPWVDQLREKDNSLEGKRLHLTKGVHIVVPYEKLPVQQSIYFDVGDGRMIFAIPRDKVTYIGTTDTNYKGDIQNPQVNEEDTNYLIQAVNQRFETITLQPNDVISAWAGLRPLIHEDGKSPSELSRSDELFESESGLITIAGGKLTGYRLMAKKVVRLICKRKGIVRKCKTRRTRLVGNGFKKPKEVLPYIEFIRLRLQELQLDTDKAFYLVHNYGTQVEEILSIYSDKKYTSITEAEAYFTLLHEGVCTLEDFFIRRTGKQYFDPKSIPNDTEKVAAIFTQTLK